MNDLFMQIIRVEEKANLPQKIKKQTHRKGDQICGYQSRSRQGELKESSRSSAGKESGCNAGDMGSIPVSGRSLGEGKGNPLQYPCLENPMDRGAWRASAHGVTRIGHD